MPAHAVEPKRQHVTTLLAGSAQLPCSPPGASGTQLPREQPNGGMLHGEELRRRPTDFVQCALPPIFLAPTWSIIYSALALPAWSQAALQPLRGTEVLTL